MENNFVYIGYLLTAFCFSFCTEKKSEYRENSTSLVYQKKDKPDTINFKKYSYLPGDKGLIKINFKDRNYFENKIEFIEDTLSEKTTIWDINDSTLTPLFFFRDGGLLYFSCTNSSKRYYEVVVDHLGKKKFLPINDLTEFVEWDDFLLNSFGVARKGETINEMNRISFHKEPSESSALVLLPNNINELLCVKTVKNNWIKIKYDCTYNSDEYLKHEGIPCKQYIDSCGESEVAWLKWENQDSLLIDVYLMP